MDELWKHNHDYTNSGSNGLQISLTMFFRRFNMRCRRQSSKNFFIGILIILLVVSNVAYDGFNLEMILGSTHKRRHSSYSVESSSASLQNKHRIGKVTMLDEDSSEVYQRILDGHRRYAEKHGYELFILRQKILHESWSMAAYMLSLILQEAAKPRGERLKWLYWSDSNVVLLNSEIPLHVFLPPEPEFRHVHLVISNDHNGLNVGGIFIRVSDWAIQFLSDCLSMPTYRPDVYLRYSQQSAMENLAKDDLYHNSTIIVPQRWFNAYRGPRDENENIKKGAKVPDNTVKKGDLHLHFAGKSENRIPMHFYINLAAGGSWDIPLENTTYPQEIKDFWERQKKIL